MLQSADSVHPLQGKTRWLGLPLLSVLSGTLAGIILDVLLKPLLGFTVHLEFTLMIPPLAGATAIGVASSTRWWIGVLIAPILGVVGFAVAATSQLSGWEPKYVLYALRVGLSPSWSLHILMSTGFVVAVHWIRMRKASTWARCLSLHGATAGLLGLVFFFIFPDDPYVFQRSFPALHYLFNAAALEVALRVSRRA